MTQFIVNAGGSLQGELHVPGDKSISHRSIIFGSLANGTTEVTGFLEGEDSLRTLKAFRDMGVPIKHEAGGLVQIEGVGLHGLKPPAVDIDLGNSGTAMRLMAGVMAGQSFQSTLCGDESLSGRPMGRIILPLVKMGAQIKSSEEQRPPLTISGTEKAGRTLHGITYQTPVASAQIKSCILLASLFASGKTSIEEPGVTRDHSERMLRGFGVPVATNGMTVSIEGGHELTATPVQVPGDISSAAFFIVGASIAKDSDILLRDVGMNPSRDGIVQIMRLMGADITVSNQREIGGEQVADLRVKSSRLRGIDVPEELVPLAIDEFPSIFIAASVARGTTRVSGAEELRVKETDRIKAMVDGLKLMGVDIVDTPDGAVIEGGGTDEIGAGVLASATVDSCGDHRIAMAFSMAGLVCEGAVNITDCDNVRTSFPDFIDLASSAGLDISSTPTDSQARPVTDEEGVS